MREEFIADTAPLMLGPDIGVANQGYVVNILRAHDPLQLAICEVSEERDAGLNFTLKLLQRHIWFVPTIIGDNTFIS